MDPNNHSLNRLTANLAKAEALIAEIASISQAAGYDGKPLISCGEDPNPPGLGPHQERPGIVGSVVQVKRAKRVKGPGWQQTSTKRAVKSKTPRTSPQPIAVPAGLMSRYDRQELYNKVWKLPMRLLAKEFGVSNVALAKTCKKLHVPVPGRGYWAKKAANQPVGARPPLPKVQVR